MRSAVPGAFAHPTYDWFHGIGRLGQTASPPSSAPHPASVSRNETRLLNGQAGVLHDRVPQSDMAPSHPRTSKARKGTPRIRAVFELRRRYLDELWKINVGSGFSAPPMT